MTSSATLQDLAGQLARAVSGGNLTLNSAAIQAPTFKWSLQTMGLASLSLQMPDPAKGIVYNAGNATLTLAGNCVLFNGWDSVPFTITLSGGDSGSTVLYANTAIAATYASFNIRNIAGSTLVPAGSVAAALLPSFAMTDVPLSVSSTSASTLPNCILSLGLPAIAITPPWDLVSALGLSMNTLGFEVVNSLNKNSVLQNAFSLFGGVKIGSILVDITIVLPVGIFTQQNSWSLSISSQVGQSGLNIASLVQNLGGINVYEVFPASLTALAEFTLTYFYVQFDPSRASVSQLQVTIGAPDWEVIPGQFTIQNTTFGVEVVNPFDAALRSTVFSIGGAFVVKSGGATVATLAAGAVLPTGGADWLFNVSGEINNVNFATLVNAAPGMKTHPPPAAPDGFNLEQISLNYLNIAYNPTSNTLSEVDLSISSKLSFPIVPKVIGVANPYFLLSLTNPLSSANNDYSGVIGGIVTLQNAPYLDLEAAVAKSTGWVFRAGLHAGATINILDLLDQFFTAGSSVPPWVGSTLEITALQLVVKTPPSGQSIPPTAYVVSGTVNWQLVVGAFSLPELTATVLIGYQSPNVSGSITVNTKLFGLDFQVGYKFGSDATDVFLVWNGITADYTATSEYSTYSLTISRLSLGGLITSVMSDIIPGFTLSPPWNLLNDVNLNGLSIVCTQYNDVSKQSNDRLVVTVPLNLNLGFIDIKTVTLTRQGSGSTAQTSLGFTGTFLGFAISSDSSNEGAKQLAGTGSPVNQMPQVPGLGGNIFRLQYLGLGQHVALYPTQHLDSVTATVAALKNVFGNPPVRQPGKPAVIPIPPKPSAPPEKSILVFDETSNWLIGLQCTIMNTVSLGVVFNDPNLYGLSVFLSGESAGTFSGLDFEILYKKVNESIGMYQIDLQLPTAMRTIELGAVSVTLPSASIQIYTNGNFMVDLGFPWGNDFSRSFTVQVFPFVGQGGFYFGVLDGATAGNSVPASQVGSFSPVIELGLGLSLGMGKTINEGILSAGLSLLAVGVFQGVLAKFNVNDTSRYPGDGVYYFKATGTFGLVGRIYGSINFAIISASFDITAYAYITITIEAYNVIAIAFSAGVSISLTVTVNLGLFKIHITFRFSAVIKASFTIGTNNTANAPWNQPLHAPAAHRLLAAQTPARYDILWQPLIQNGTKPTLTLMYLPLLSLSGAAGSNTAQFVNLLFIDAPDPLSDTGSNDSGFTALATAVLQWAINAIVNSRAADTTVAALMSQAVTLDQLQAVYCYLTYESDHFFPILYSNTAQDKEFDIRAFLDNYFTIEIRAENVDGDENNATVFPMLPDLVLNDSLNGTAGTPVDFSANPQPFSYLGTVQEQLQRLAVQFRSAAEAVSDNPSDCPPVTDSSLPATPPAVSFASFIVQDYFEMLVKNVVQDAINAFGRFSYPVTATTTLGAVVDYFTAAPLNNTVSAARVANANGPVRLTADQRVTLPGIAYPVATSDTFNGIVATYNKYLSPANQLTAAQLATDFNTTINGLIVPGTLIQVSGFNTYRVIATDTLASIAANLVAASGLVNATVAQVIDAVAGQAVLAPLTVIQLPELVYTTGNDDSFQSLSGTYGLTIDALATANPQVTFNATSLVVPAITTLGVQDIINQVITRANINRYSSMAARFMLHGLNLPDPSDTTTVKPLYVLTGQQLAVPALNQNDTYNLQLTPGANGSWISLAATPLLLNVDNHEISRIADLLTLPLTQNTSAQPPAALTMYQDANQTFTLKSTIAWQYPGTLVLPVGTPPAQVVGTPSVWYFPNALTSVLQADNNLELELLLQTPNADGHTYAQSSVQNYGWATMVNISVEKFTDGAHQAPVFANTYTLAGATGGDIIYLERIVAALNSGNGPRIDQVRILYAPAATGNAAANHMQSSADGEYEIGIVKTNLSTETNPETSLLARVAENGTGYLPPAPNTLNDYTEFLSFAWQCSIVRSGGFYLYYHQKNGGTGLPDSLFSNSPTAALYLLITYQGAPSGNYLNAVAVGDPIETGKSVLFVQSQALTARNAIMPPGNAGFQLSISNPGAYTPLNPYPIPANAASRANDLQFLQNQFNLVMYQLVGNGAFNGSPQSLMPVGPVNNSSPDDPNPPASPDLWPYKGTLPVYSFAKNAIQPADPGFPPASGDPYSGNGNQVQVQLSLADLFGNPIRSNISGADGLVTIPVAYTDNLVALSQWPGITTRYSFPVISGTPNLQVDLCFDTSRYANDNGNVSPQQLALVDMGTYASIYYQLIQPDVQVTYRTSLYNSSNDPVGVPLTPNKSLSAFAGTLYAYLQNIAYNKPQTVSLSVPWSLTAPVSASNTENIFELTTELTIQRTTNIHPDFKEVPAVGTVTTAIKPITQLSCTGSAAEGTQALTYFAVQFEATFTATPAAGAFLKVASGVDSNNVASNGNSQKVWVVRFDKAGKSGINVAFNQADNQPVSYFYSPSPLSTSLIALNSVPITKYTTGQPFIYNNQAPAINYTAVNMDQWALVCLQAIDNFLSPQFAVPAFLIDNGKTLQTVLDAKASLANYITGTVTNILDQPLTQAQITNAQEVFNQQLLINLSNAYNITAIIQHPLTVNSQYTGSNLAPYNTAPVNPRLYGSMYGQAPQPVGSTGGDGTGLSDQYSFTNAKAPLGNGTSWVNYCLYVKEAARVNSFRFSQLNFVLSNIEQQIENVPNAAGYQSSTWLAFVIPLASDAFSTGGAVDIPVPLRAYPVPPSTQSQWADYSQNNVIGATTTIDAALQWSFAFAYGQQEATQDVIEAQVIFNSTAGQSVLRSAKSNDIVILAKALAQFITVLPALNADFLTYVARVTPEDVAGNTAVAVNAKIAVGALGTLMGILATG